MAPVSNDTARIEEWEGAELGVHRGFWQGVGEVNVFRLEMTSAERRLGRRAVDLGQRARQALQRDEDLTEKRPLLAGKLDARLQQTAQGFRRVGAHVVQIGTQETPTDHEQNLWVKSILRSPQFI